jgi:hypothetical protein
MPNLFVRSLLAVTAAALCAPALALAHGDPASHYLETGSLYPSFAAQPSQSVELELIGLLDAARQAGYPLKVALVADESDVADTPAMLRRPQAYAQYVVSALKGSRIAVEAPVVIVTPYGVGVAGPGAKPMPGVSTGSGGDALARSAMTAVRAVAGAGGHPLPAHVPPAQVAVPPPAGSGSGYDLGGLAPLAVFAAVFGGAALLFELRSRLSRRGAARLSPTSDGAA